MKLNEVLELIEALHDSKEQIALISGSIKDLLLTLGPDVKDLVLKMCLGYADIQSEVFKFYIEEGFTREEAFTLILNINMALSSINKRK